MTHFYGTAPDLPPATGVNPSYGASVFFNLPKDYNGKTPLTLTFQDAAGATVRSFTLHLKPKHETKVPPEVRSELQAIPKRELDLATVTAVSPGMNRFLWDLRYTPDTEIFGFREPSALDFSAAVDGPTVVPGKYTAVLRYGGKTLQQQFDVRLDPGLKATADDLDARLALERQVHATLDTLNKTINDASKQILRLTPAKRAELEKTIASLVQFNIHSSEGDVLHETKLRSHLAFLFNELETAFERPTPAEYAAYDELKAKADAGIAKLQTLTTQ